ncbi:hypothetical protein AAZX31_07G083800 [Glycine max]
MNSSRVSSSPYWQILATDNNPSMHSWSISSSSACSKNDDRAATTGPAMQANISLHILRLN